MKLADLQDIFQRGLLSGDQEGAGQLAILNEVNTSDKEQKDVLFGVYRNAYVLRLIEFLQGDYEKLEVYLGDQGFDDMARAYIAAHPSASHNARWFGAALPDFLEKTAPWSDLPQLSELAAFDKALLDSFDAADAPHFSSEDMATVTDFAALVLYPHPASARLDLKTNASAIREALLEEQEPPALEMLEEPQKWLFYRSGDMQSMYRQIGYEEAMMWDEMVKGVDFAGLCEILAHYSNEEEAPMQAAGYLQNWMAASLLMKA